MIKLSFLTDIFNKFKGRKKKEEEVGMSTEQVENVMAKNFIRRPSAEIPDTNVKKAESAAPKKKVTCVCGYEFSTVPEKRTSIMCPWCNRELEQ